MRPDFLTQPDLHPAHRTPRVRQSPAQYGDPIEHYRRPGIRWRRAVIGAALIVCLIATIALLGV